MVFLTLSVCTLSKELVTTRRSPTFAFAVRRQFAAHEYNVSCSYSPAFSNNQDLKVSLHLERSPRAMQLRRRAKSNPANVYTSWVIDDTHSSHRRCRRRRHLPASRSLSRSFMSIIVDSRQSRSFIPRRRQQPRQRRRHSFVLPFLNFSSRGAVTRCGVRARNRQATHQAKVGLTIGGLPIPFRTATLREKK